MTTKNESPLIHCEGLSKALRDLDSEAEVWGHLSSTVLPVYLGNSLILLLGVGMGTLVLGVVSGFLTALYEFPGRRWLE
jgi:iron(III) transport system permease protein